MGWVCHGDRVGRLRMSAGRKQTDLDSKKYTERIGISSMSTTDLSGWVHGTAGRLGFSCVPPPIYSTCHVPFPLVCGIHRHATVLYTVLSAPLPRRRRLQSCIGRLTHERLPRFLNQYTSSGRLVSSSSSSSSLRTAVGRSYHITACASIGGCRALEGGHWQGPPMC